MSAQPSSSPSTPAPWRELFLEHVSAMSQATFTLATSQLVPDSGGASHAAVPRARTCIFRGMWGLLPDNPKNKASRNPAGVYSSDLPVFTTDARMEKAAQLLGTAKVSGATGGGAPVEAVWWCEDGGTQWRLRGVGYLLGPDVEAEEGEAARKALLGRMRKDGGHGSEEKDWSWKREVTGHFGNLSPMMRGTFRNPAPGTPRATPPAEGEALGQKVDDLEDDLARANFRVVVIVPHEVDQCDLSDSANPRRWLYTYRGLSYKSTQPGGDVIGEWEKIEVWP